MRFAHTTIAVAGTHSTGKTTFLNDVAEGLAAHGLRVGRVADTASRAKATGFPILRDHGYESTLWIMAEGLRQEMEAALAFDVVLVDRPLVDALGYLSAALAATERSIPPSRFDELAQIARAHQSRYDWFAATVLDEAIPTDAGRDPDEAFRRLAGEKIQELASAHTDVRWLTSRTASSLTDEAVLFATVRRERG